jgi:hypothetical protein
MSSAIGRAWFTMRKPRTLRRLTIRRAGFRQRDILKAAGAAAIELLFARSAPRLGAGGAGVGGDKTFSTCVKRSHGGVGGGWRTSSHITVGHAPTCEVTIFIFRSKFLSYSREGLARRVISPPGLRTSTLRISTYQRTSTAPRRPPPRDLARDHAKYVTASVV